MLSPQIPAVLLVAALLMPGAGLAPRARTLWSGPGITLTGGPSRDGQLLSFADPATGALSVRDLSSGVVRAIASRGRSSKEYAYFSVFSRDARHIAYAWFNHQGFYDLRVAATDGSGYRVLYSNEHAGFVQPCAWTPDGSAILTLFFRKDNISQIALVPAAGGSPKILRSLNWVYPKRMDLSPDGRFLVYDSFAAGTSGDRTIYLLAVDGSRETKLVQSTGSHLFPLWTQDGDAVVYTTERDGVTHIMRLAVAEGRPAGEPQMLVENAGRILLMGTTLSGDLIAGVRLSQSDVFITDLSDPAGHARRATLRFPGRNSGPSWSPDGRMLAYLSRRGGENFGEESRAIVIRSMDSDEERELNPKLAHIERVRWSPDATALLVSGNDGKGRAGLFEVNPHTGAVRALVAEPGTGTRGIEGVWSADGKYLYYIYGDTEVRRRVAATGEESVVHSGTDLCCITSSGGRMAFIEGTNTVVAAGTKRRVPVGHLRELEWGGNLVAGDGADLWLLPRDGGAPIRNEMPGNRHPGFSLHPDGRTVAITAGKSLSEIRAIRVR